MDGQMVFTPGYYSDARRSLGVIHILVVDDDPTCLAIVGGLLKTCKYNVLTVKHPNDALAILRMKQGLIDLVVTDVHMPDMNGFELQKIVVEEFKLPVIMMSADDRQNVILKGLQGGAAFFMVKPIRADDVKDLWQYTIARKKGKSTVVFEETGCDKGLSFAKKKPEYEDLGSTSFVNKMYEEERKKRKVYKKRTPKRANETRVAVNAASKTIRKPKVIWKTSLHNRFLYAIKQIGLEKCVPKKILEFMKVPGLTRENVASHLQKYRIFLRRVADTSDEAARQTVERVLLRSSFAPSHSSLIFNSFLQNYPEFSEQQLIKRACQPGFGMKDGPIYKAPNKGPYYSNQEASKSNSITPFKYGKSHSSLNKSQANLLPQNNLYQAKSSSFGLKRLNNTRIGDVSSGLMASTNAMQVYQNQAQRSIGFMTNIGTNGLMTSTNSMSGYQNQAPTRLEFTKGSSSYNFTTNGLGIKKYTSGMENMGLYNDNPSNFNNSKYLNENNNYADTLVTNYGGNLAEYGDQMGGYVGEASGGFGGSYFSNLGQQDSALVLPPPPPSLQESEENDGTDSSNLFGSKENSSTFNSNSLQPFTEGGPGDIFFQQIDDQSPNQQGGEKVAEPVFFISPNHVDDPQEIVQLLNQTEGSEEVITNEKLSDNKYLADDILSWFDPQPNQDGRVGEGMAGDSLFGIDAYNPMG